LLAGWDFRDTQIEPECALKVGDEFKNWIEKEKGDAWFAAGGWVDYPVLCRWHVYQEIAAVIKKDLRGKRPLPHTPLGPFLMG
jgi:hypothetical protein